MLRASCLGGLHSDQPRLRLYCVPSCLSVFLRVAYVLVFVYSCIRVYVVYGVPGPFSVFVWRISRMELQNFSNWVCTVVRSKKVELQQEGGVGFWSMQQRPPTYIPSSVNYLTVKHQYEVAKAPKVRYLLQSRKKLY